jgi:hypothetical protein
MYQKRIAVQIQSDRRLYPATHIAIMKIDSIEVILVHVSGACT